MIEEPVFVVGTGRCGSTVFHDVLSRHGDLGWLTQLVEARPASPALNRAALSALRLPGIGALADRLFYPAEPYRFWERYCRGFSRPYRDLLAEDVTPRAARLIRTALTQAVPTERRILAKITGWPRVRYLQEIFPDARFVHVVRDGRAVVNSVLAAPFFDGWGGPWQWARGSLDRAQRRAWRASGESFVVLAAIGWENRMRAFEAARDAVPRDRYLEIRYEEFCTRPADTLAGVLGFLGLGDSPRSRTFLDDPRRRTLRSQNDKWKEDLSPRQQALLQDYLAPTLERWGYGTESD